MKYKIEILKSPRSDAETIAGAEALLHLKGVVPNQTLADALAGVCSFTAALAKLNAFNSDHFLGVRIPVIWKSLDSMPGFDQVYRLDFRENVPPNLAGNILVPAVGVPSAAATPIPPDTEQSSTEASPAPAAGIPSAPTAVTSLAPVQSTQLTVTPAPAERKGFRAWLRGLLP